MFVPKRGVREGTGDRRRNSSQTGDMGKNGTGCHRKEKERQEAEGKKIEVEFLKLPQFPWREADLQDMNLGGGRGDWVAKREEGSVMRASCAGLFVGGIP